MLKFITLYFFFSLFISSPNLLYPADFSAGGGSERDEYWASSKKSLQFINSLHFLASRKGKWKDLLDSIAQLEDSQINFREMLVRHPYNASMPLRFEGTLLKIEDSALVLQEVRSDFLPFFRTKTTVRIQLPEEDLISWTECMEPIVNGRVRFNIPEERLHNFRVQESQTADQITFSLSVNSAVPVPLAYWKRSPLDIAMINRDRIMLEKVVPFVLQDPSIFPAVFGQLLHTHRTPRNLECGVADISVADATLRTQLQEEFLKLAEDVAKVNKNKGRNDPSIPRILYRMADNSRLRGEFDTAWTLVNKCKEIHSECFSHDIELKIQIDYLSAILTYNEGQMEEAELLLRKVLAEALRNMSKNIYPYARAGADTLRELLNSQGKKNQAEDLKINFTKALGIEGANSEYKPPLRLNQLFRNVWPHIRFELLLRLYDKEKTPKLPDTFVHFDELTAWLTPNELSFTPRVIGVRDATGLQNKVPCVFFATRARHIPALRALVENKASTSYLWSGSQNKFIPTEEGGEVEEGAHSTLLSLTSNGPEGRAVSLLLRGGADPNMCSPLYFGARVGNKLTVRRLLEAKAEVNKEYKKGGTPIIPAAQQGHAHVLQELINAKADVNYTVEDGTSPIYYAAQEGHVDACEVLLIAGANINQTENLHHIQPLYIATSQGHFEVVELLIARKADLDHRRDTGATALCCAARRGETHNDILKLLVEAKADPNLDEEVTTPSGQQTRRPPIMHAFKLRNKQAVLFLLSSPLPLNYKYRRWNAMYAAVVNDWPDIIRLLVHRGASMGSNLAFVSMPGQQSQSTHPVRTAVELRRIGCLLELALLTPENIHSGNTFFCQYACGFRGPYEVVDSHEKSQCPKRPMRFRSSGGSGLRQQLTDSWSKAEERVISPDEKNCLDLFREMGVAYVAGNPEDIGRVDPSAHYLKLIKGWSRFHHCAAAGDAAQMFRALVGKYGGFHSSNRSELRVDEVRELAFRRQLLRHRFGEGWSTAEESVLNSPYADYENDEITYLIQRASGCWHPDPGTHVLFGLSDHFGIEAVLLSGYVLDEFRPQSSVPINIALIGFIGRGWFEFDGTTPEGAKRRMLEFHDTVTASKQVEGSLGHQIRNLRKRLSLSEANDNLTSKTHQDIKETCLKLLQELESQRYTNPRFQDERWRSLRTLASILKDLGLYKKALKLYDQVYNHICSVNGETPHSISTLVDIAKVYEKQSKFDFALKYHHRAWLERVRLYGPLHALTLGSLYNILLMQTRLEGTKWCDESSIDDRIENGLPAYALSLKALPNPELFAKLILKHFNIGSFRFESDPTGWRNQEPSASATLLKILDMFIDNDEFKTYVTHSLQEKGYRERQSFKRLASEDGEAPASKHRCRSQTPEV